MLIKLIAAPYFKLSTLFLLLFFSAISQSAEIPKLNAWVIDQTKTLSKQQINIISEKLAQHEKDSSNQLVVLIIKTLDNEDIKTYAARVIKDWQLGQPDKENGIVLVIAKNDHMLWIEVGTDLKNNISDEATKNIIKNDMMPLIKQNNYFSAINMAVDQLIIKGSVDKTDIKELIPNWPISLTFICSIFTLFIPLSLYALSGHFSKNQLSLKACYIIYFIPSIILSLALLTLFGSSIKSNTVTLIYGLTITLSSYVSIGLLFLIVNYIRRIFIKNK